MKTLEEVKARLDGMNAEAVARDTGIHGNVIRGIRRGEVLSPAYLTVKILSDYFEAREVKQ